MSELKKMTKLGGDVRKIAALLQSKAPKGHMLAYINPEEAALLKSRGGSGEPHADTGIPSFDNGFDLGSFEDIAAADQVAAAPEPPVPQFSTAPLDSAGLQPLTQAQISGQPVTPVTVTPEVQPVTPTFTPGQQAYFAGQDIQDQLAAAGGRDLSQVAQLPEPPKTMEQRLQDLEKGLNKYPTLTRSLTGAGFGLAGALAGRRGAKQAEGMRQEIAGIGQQYSKMGQDLLGKAQRGELTPVQQQQAQAYQAQLAQDIQRRGGVGVQQAQAAYTNFVNQLTQNNIQEAMQYINLGDQYQMQAIRAGYAANQDAQNAAMKFYTAMGNFLAPGAQTQPVARTTPATPGVTG